MPMALMADDDLRKLRPNHELQQLVAEIKTSTPKDSASNAQKAKQLARTDHKSIDRDHQFSTEGTPVVNLAAQ